MISTSLHGLARALRNRPDLADLVAKRLDALAEDVAILEAAPVPDYLRTPTALPAGVTDLGAWRRQRA